MAVELKPSHLKVIASLLVDIAAGLLLLFPTLPNPIVLTFNAFFFIVCVVSASKIEELLEEL